jgi:hypothetical protein
MIKRTIRFFDRLEDKTRIALSHHPFLYSFIGGIGIVLFWKGVWETAELYPWLFGPMSVIVGVIILLMTGLLVSFFIGDNIILSGLKKEKKLTEKTENEICAEKHSLEYIVDKLEVIEAEMKELNGKGNEEGFS